MIILTGLFIILFLYLAYVNLTAYLNRDPSRSVSAVYKKSVETKKSLMDQITVNFLLPLAKHIAPRLKLSKEREVELKAKLERAGIMLTPKEYYARPIAAFILFTPFIFAAYIAGLDGIAIGAFVAIAAVLCYKLLMEVDDKLEKKREEIEKELPSFIRSIIYKLDDDVEGVVKADLVSIFEDYAKVGKSVFLYDVNYLIMDMKGKDAESALRAMDTRMCIREVSFLCNALIGLTRGEHQGSALETLAHDMDIKAKANIEREIGKRPAQMKRAILPVIGVTVAAYIYILGKYIFDMFYQIL